jgi:multidrug efflux pump subunit AcrB
MIRFFAAHPTAANLLMILLVVIGFSSLPGMKRETFPDFTPQEIEIRIPYPGASSEDVESAICRRIEDATDGVTHVSELRCQALESLAIAVAKMSESGDFSRFLDDVKTEVEAIDDFPDLVEKPVVRQLGMIDNVVSIAVSGPMSVNDLKAYAEALKERLQRQPGVSQVNILGFSERQLQVRVSSRILRRHGVSITDLANLIKRQNVDLPSGAVQTAERDFLVRFTDQRRTARDLEDLIVIGASSGGGELRLGDVAEVTDRFELDEEKYLHNGRRAALLKVNKTKGQDTLDVMDVVATFVDREQQMAPPGVALAITQNISSIVRDRLQMLLKNGLQGLILVFIVMWLFFRLRFSFWVTVGLPISFLGGLFFMYVLGQSINMISMVALLIALGLLMDDAIVIAENIATQLRKGKSALEAAVEGTKQVMPGVLSSFLTSVAVFTPLAFLSGDMGKVLKVIPIVLIAVLAVSLIEAFLILPHHLAHSLKGHESGSENRLRMRIDAIVEWLRSRFLGRLVDSVIRWRYLFLGAVFSMLLFTVGMVAGGHVKFLAFPDVEGDVVQARVLLPQGTPLWRTESVVDRLLTALDEVNNELTPQQPGGQTLVEDVSVRFNENLDAFETGAHVATISADLLTAELREDSVDDILGQWREKTGVLADVISLSFKEPQIGPAGRAIEIRLKGDDLDMLKAASLELQEWLSGYAGVLDLSDDLRPGKPELRLRLSDGSLAFGAQASVIADQLRAGFFGTTVDEIQVGPESYEIDLRLEELDRSSVQDLLEFRIVTSKGRSVPLGAVADLEVDRGYSRIHRIDRRRTVTVTGDVDVSIANAQQIIGDTMEDFVPKLSRKYPQLTIGQQGQSAESGKTGASMITGFALGLIGVFILLSFQFRSYIEPVAVMSVIPLAMAGVVWGHVVMGLELSMPSMMGAVSLSGIVVNDSILLVEFLKLRAREGLEIPQAATIASRERFRAVLLTSLTTIAGLTPLLLEKSLQAQVLIPLATSIVFGLLTSTMLVLLVVPALFSIFSDFGWTSVQKEREMMGMSSPGETG